VSLSENLKIAHPGLLLRAQATFPIKSGDKLQFYSGRVVKGYEDAGACGISVLTDGKYFGGSLDALWQEPQ
jgi:indole-3-glycerol phosphate synthase